MMVQLSKHFGQPVRPVKDYCAALSTWFGIYKEKADETSQAILYKANIDLSKSNLLWRMIYNGEKLRLNPCPIHKGKWSGYSFDGCFVGCEESGWLPNELNDEIVGLQDDALLLCLLMKNEWLKAHTDDQVKEKLRYSPTHPLFGSFSRQLVEEYLAKRKR